MASESFWNWAISISIIGGLILTIWARVSRQTIGELLKDIKDAFTGTAEETTEAMVWNE